MQKRLVLFGLKLTMELFTCSQGRSVARPRQKSETQSNRSGQAEPWYGLRRQGQIFRRTNDDRD
jgi:hypothetical protein